MILAFSAIEEAHPGEKWRALFHKTWPLYHNWFMSEGLMARKGYLTSVTMLKKYMPELMPVYENLVALSGGGDIEARYLSMYCPPAYMSGCSQMALNKKANLLIRNYDYSPHSFEGVLLKTSWLKEVIGVSDCNWGLLDGINEDGLAASLAFGGRSVTGEGFGIPLIIRYILETTSTVEEAKKVLYSIPVHMTYNVTLADAKGNSATLYLAPDRHPVEAHLPLATNHQEAIEWPQYAKLTATKERKNVLENILMAQIMSEEEIIQHFFKPPLFNYNYLKNFGTLYTAVYRIDQRELKLFLPGHQLMQQNFTDFREHTLSLHLPDAVH